MLRTISSSDGFELHFKCNEQYKEYVYAHRQLIIETYKKIRAKHGIWASNQNKFVSDPSELKEWDSKFMESLAGF